MIQRIALITATVARWPNETALITETVDRWRKEIALITETVAMWPNEIALITEKVTRWPNETMEVPVLHNEVIHLHIPGATPRSSSHGISDVMTSSRHPLATWTLPRRKRAVKNLNG